MILSVSVSRVLGRKHVLLPILITRRPIPNLLSGLSRSTRITLPACKANRECYSAWRINGYGVLTGLFAILCKPLRKLRQFAGPAPRQVK